MKNSRTAASSSLRTASNNSAAAVESLTSPLRSLGTLRSLGLFHDGAHVVDATASISLLTSSPHRRSTERQ